MLPEVIAASGNTPAVLPKCYQKFPEYIMHAVGQDDGKTPQEIEKRLRVAEVAKRKKKKSKASEVEAINSMFDNLQERVDEISNKVLCET
uniref:Uncharacterized protein n=1 Tax=Magallana gigas TaxID=29159 RepID=K1RCC3_MAGGI